jgi:Serine dehydrogenase proteinase
MLRAPISDSLRSNSLTRADNTIDGMTLKQLRKSSKQRASSWSVGFPPSKRGRWRKSSRPVHDYPIWASTAKSLGLPVSTDMPNGVLELMKLYPQPVRMQSGGGVEYLPVPRQKEVAREA